MQRIFEALASPVRRKILAYLAHTELSAGDIASRFEMSKPSISQHLAVLEAAGLVESTKRGQFVYYRQVSENLINTLNGFVQEACPIGRPLRKESAALAKKGEPNASQTTDTQE
jgi:ArsR family transcriptional regulator, arsenate/arsenite/antimonite-responsive transcriptional repressor